MIETHACEPKTDCPVRSGEPCPTCEKAKCEHVMCQSSSPPPEEVAPEEVPEPWEPPPHFMVAPAADEPVSS